MKKQTVFILITISVALTCNSSFAITEVGKLAHQFYLGKLKFDTYNKKQQLIAACDHDKRAGNNQPEKEAAVCKEFLKNELVAQSSYNNYIKTCSLKKFDKYAKNNKALINHKFVNSLSKQGKLYLIESKNPDDRKQLNILVDKAVAETQKKELPAFETSCKRSLTYADFYNNYLIPGKTPNFS